MYHPVSPGGALPRGVSTPTLTAFTRTENDIAVAEADQRNLLTYVMQSGFGTDIVFGMGTTGEWNRVSNAVRQDAMRIHAETLAAWNAGRSPAGREPVHRDGHARIPCWVGITASTRAEVLDNLAAACALPVDAAVIAPLSVADIGPLTPFFARDMLECMYDHGRVVPVVLYDNADIAADPDVQHLRTRDVKQLSRLDCVVGVKVTASRHVIGNYIKASAHFNEAHEFGVYAGNALAVFDMFRPARGWIQSVRAKWHAFLMHGGIPAGVVPGYANLFPREWQFVWQACLAGDDERLTALQDAFTEFGRLCVFNGNKKTLASMKQGLKSRGVIRSPAVAPGTPELTGDEAAEFDARLAAFRPRLADICGPRWTSRWPVATDIIENSESADGAA